MNNLALIILLIKYNNNVQWHSCDICICVHLRHVTAAKSGFVKTHTVLDEHHLSSLLRKLAIKQVLVVVYSVNVLRGVKSARRSLRLLHTRTCS